MVIATDVPARVDRIVAYTERLERHGGTSIVPSTSLACESTPCVLTLPYGDYELWFTGTSDRSRASTTVLHVQAPTVVLNHTLGQERANPAATAAGAIALIGLVAIGIAVKTSSPQAGWFGFGALAIGTGIAIASPTFVTPSATTQWVPLPARPAPERPTAGAAVVVRF